MRIASLRFVCSFKAEKYVEDARKYHILPLKSRFSPWKPDFQFS